MPETPMIAFSHKEVVEALLRGTDIHEGIWGIYFEFGFSGANITQPDGNLVPAAIVPVVRIGLQRFPEANNLTVDAAEANPIRKTKKTPK